MEWKKEEYGCERLNVGIELSLLVDSNFCRWYLSGYSRDAPDERGVSPTKQEAKSRVKSAALRYMLIECLKIASKEQLISIIKRL